MHYGVLDQGDDVGVGDLAGAEVGEYEGAGRVQCLFEGLMWSMQPIVLPRRTGPSERPKDPE